MCCVCSSTNKRYSQKREMAQHVTGSIADLHAEHQLAPAEQTGNRESSGGGGVCTCVCGWVVCGRRVDKVLAGMPKMKEINGLISLRWNVKSLPRTFHFCVSGSIFLSSLLWPWFVSSSYRTALSVEIKCVCRYRVTFIATSLSVVMTARSIDGIAICRAKYVQLAVSHSLKDTAQTKATRHPWLIKLCSFCTMQQWTGAFKATHLERGQQQTDPDRR